MAIEEDYSLEESLKDLAVFDYVRPISVFIDSISSPVAHLQLVFKNRLHKVRFDGELSGDPQRFLGNRFARLDLAVEVPHSLLNNLSDLSSSLL